MTITARIDNTTAIQSEYMGTFLPAPRSVKIELTSKCNLRCSFCSHGNMTTIAKTMSWPLYTRLVQEMAEAGVRELGLFYIGESMSVPWLQDAVAYAKSAGIDYVFLTTNGTLATAERVEPLMQAGLDSLKFSFNAADPEQFHEITNSSPRLFHRQVANIKAVKAARDKGGYSTKLYASSIHYDGEQLKRMEAAVAEIRPYLDEHYWLPLYSFGAQATREKEFGWIPGAGNQGRLDAMRPPLPCWAGFKEGHITVDGKMSFCCFDAAEKWIMADLNQVNFMDGWNSAEYQALRAKHLARDVHGTACATCIYGEESKNAA